MTLLAYVPGTEAWRKRKRRELCAQAAERIQEIVDGEVPAGKAARALEHHLQECPPCHQEAEVLRTLKQAIARVSSEADRETVDRLNRLAQRLCRGEDV